MRVYVYFYVKMYEDMCILRVICLYVYMLQRIYVTVFK